MTTNTAPHPRDALFDATEATTALPVCDHYCGVEARMRKSLALQVELGPVFDITLDCEDGAPIGRAVGFLGRALRLGGRIGQGQDQRTRASRKTSPRSWRAPARGSPT